jgi:hypothetical protein
VKFLLPALVEPGDPPPPADPHEEVEIDVGAEIDRRTVRNGACLIWTGPMKPSGLPYLRVGVTFVSVRRIQYVRWHGSPAPRLITMTTCGRQACLEPDHLVPVDRRWLKAARGSLVACLAAGERERSRQRASQGLEQLGAQTGAAGGIVAADTQHAGQRTGEHDQAVDPDHPGDKPEAPLDRIEGRRARRHRC